MTDAVVAADAADATGAAQDDAVVVKGLPVPATELAGLARCTACGKMYDADEAGPCRFHPGTWVNATSTSRMLPHRKWSCCGKSAESALGCKTRAAHTQCVATAMSLLNFPVVDASAYSEMRRRVQAPEEAAPAAPAVPTGAPPDAEQFTVGVGDSLNAIALRHRMRKDQIVKWNKLLGGSIYPGQKLWLRPPASTETDVEKVARLAKCDEQEAAFYLDSAGGDVEAAVREHAADAEWDMANAA